MGRFARGAAAFCALASASIAFPARAQPFEGFALDHFRPAAADSAWFIADSFDWSDSEWTLRAIEELAIQPLSVTGADGRTTAFVEHQAALHLGASYSPAEPFRIAALFPVILSQGGNDLRSDGGTSVRAPRGVAPGDLRLAVYGRRSPNDDLDAGAGVALSLPTGDPERFAGDGVVRIAPSLYISGRQEFVEFAASLELDVRTDERAFGSVPIGSTIRTALAIGVRAIERRLLVGPELWATTSLASANAFADEATTPIELLLGAHYAVDRIRAGAGVGGGLTDGFGAPALRVVLSAGLFFEPSPTTEVLPPAEATPVAWQPPPPDSDRDGVSDAFDACPTIPGVRAAEVTRHGCPSPGYYDQSLTPADRDGDGVDDMVDGCPNEPGLRSDDAAANGCPAPPDADRDGIVDAQDACPAHSGEPHAEPRRNGCPLALVEESTIRIFDTVSFATGSDAILDESAPLLEAIARLLADRPDLTRIGVEGHTDDRGAPPLNRALSLRRARAVEQWLVRNGVSPERLVATGRGADSPIDTNDTPEGRSNNRRVEFRVLERTGPSEPAGPTVRTGAARFDEVSPVEPPIPPGVPVPNDGLGPSGPAENATE